MPFALAAWLPSLIMGGGSVLGALFGSRAQGKAAKESSDASERSAEMQLEFGREQLRNLREIYNLDLSLQWPTHRLAGESLGNLARGMGSKLDPSGLRDLRGAAGTSDAFSRGAGRWRGGRWRGGAVRTYLRGIRAARGRGRWAGERMGFTGTDCRGFSRWRRWLPSGRQDRARPPGSGLPRSSPGGVDPPHSADRIRGRQSDSRRDDDGRGLDRRLERRAVHAGSLLRFHATL